MTSDRSKNRAAQRRAELAAERAHEDDKVRSSGGRGESFSDVFTRRISRRGFLKAGAAAAALVLSPGAASTAAQTMGKARGPRPAQGIRFSPLGFQPASNQWVKVADGYGH